MPILLAMYPSFNELILSLEKLDALLRVASSADLTGQNPQTVFHYFWIAESMLEKAKNACDILARKVILSEEN